MEARNNGFVSGWTQEIMGEWMEAGENGWVDRGR